MWNRTWAGRVRASLGGAGALADGPGQQQARAGREERILGDPLDVAAGVEQPHLQREPAGGLQMEALGSILAFASWRASQEKAAACIERENASDLASPGRPRSTHLAAAEEAVQHAVWQNRSTPTEPAQRCGRITIGIGCQLIALSASCCSNACTARRAAQSAVSHSIGWCSSHGNKQQRRAGGDKHRAAHRTESLILHPRSPPVWHTSLSGPRSSTCSATTRARKGWGGPMPRAGSYGRVQTCICCKIGLEPLTIGKWAHEPYRTCVSAWYSSSTETVLRLDMANHLTLPELDAGWFADAALEQPLSPSLADIFKSDVDSGAESGLHRAPQVLPNP